MVADLKQCLKLLILGIVPSQALRFGLINTGSEALASVVPGFFQRCAELGIEAINRTNIRVSGNATLTIDSYENFYDLLYNVGGIDGIAFKKGGGEVMAERMREIVKEAFDMGIPSVTIDGDLENSTRVAYVGTNQEFMGETMARTLRQLVPDGGTYALVDDKEGRTEGLVREISRYNDTDGNPLWTLVNFTYETDEEEEKECAEYSQTRVCYMEKYAEANVTAMLFLKQSPMRIDNYTDFMDRHRHRKITFIGTDDSSYQLDYLATGYVDGLVGQMPYFIGRRAVDVLYEALQNPNLETELDAYGTNLIAHSIIPFDLTQPNVDHNLLRNLSITGFVSFGISASFALICIAWTIYHRKSMIVKLSQPGFLVMVAFGALILASSIVPLSFDDGGGQLKNPNNSISEQYSVAICMSIPWLAFTGFTLMFAALFAKTWRVNKIFDKKQGHTKMLKVEAKDVMAPLAILLVCNFIVLICWTVLDPLTYTRIELEGTDYWNRVIETTGGCRSAQVEAYLIPLVIINFIALAVACWQAFLARDIDSNFSETRFIGFSLASILQTFLSGIPIIAVVRDLPDAFYLITTFMIFALTVVILMFIFLPKMYKQHQFTGLSKKEQMMVIKQSIQASVPTSQQLMAGSESIVSHNPSSGVPSGMMMEGPISSAPQSFMGKASSTNAIHGGSQQKSSTQESTVTNSTEMKDSPDKEAAP